MRMGLLENALLGTHSASLLGAPVASPLAHYTASNISIDVKPYAEQLKVDLTNCNFSLLWNDVC